MKFKRILILIFAVFSAILPAKANDQDLLVFAAASLRDVMLKIGAEYQEICNCNVKFSFASSSVLARQIDAGAPADLLISANRDWVDWLRERNLTSNKPIVIAKNRLVIASRAKTKDSFNILFRGRFSMGDPSGVPAGIYAMQALENMEIWNDAKSNAVFTENVRVALSMVVRGDLQAGIVYASDLKAAPELHSHFLFPEKTHEPIEYLALDLLKENSEAGSFIAFLLSHKAQQTLKTNGFLSVSDE